MEVSEAQEIVEKRELEKRAKFIPVAIPPATEAVAALPQETPSPSTAPSEPFTLQTKESEKPATLQFENTTQQPPTLALNENSQTPQTQTFSTNQTTESPQVEKSGSN